VELRGGSVGVDRAAGAWASLAARPYMQH